MKFRLLFNRILQGLGMSCLLLGSFAHAQLEDMPSVTLYTKQDAGKVLQQNGVYNVFDGFVQTQGAQMLQPDGLPFSPSTLNQIDGRAVMPRQTWDAIGSIAKTYFRISGTATINKISYGFISLSTAGEAYKEGHGNIPVDPAVAFFGNDLVTFPNNTPGTDQWYFSFTFKSLFHFAGDNWFFFDEFNGIMYVNIDSGSLANGFWGYLMVGNHSSWVFLGRDGNFYDLRDPEHDGINTLPNDQAGAQTLDGYLFMETPFEGDPAGSAWYYFSQFPTGNWMLNMNIQNPEPEDWHLVKGPVSTQN